MFRNNWFKVTSLGVVLLVVLTACAQAQASAPAASTTLDSPNGHWIGPETVAAAQKQPDTMLTTGATLDNPNGHWIGPETVAAAQKQLDTVPTTGGVIDATTGWRDAGAGGR